MSRDRMESKLFSPRRYYHYYITRRPWCYHHSVFCSVFLLLVLLLACLHFILLPTINGAYNDECYLAKEKLQNLRYAVQAIGKTMAKYNITYWLDYGTLLGAIRQGDVLPWDGDADISFLYEEENLRVHDDLGKSYGINSNGLQANYKGLNIDYVRWVERKGSYNGKKDTILHMFYPNSVLANENVLVTWNHKLESFPKSWLVPRKMIRFQGVMLHIPKSSHKLLFHRYSLTYKLGLSVPYKWKCYIPCWMRHANDC